MVDHKYELSNGRRLEANNVFHVVIEVEVDQILQLSRSEHFRITLIRLKEFQVFLNSRVSQVSNGCIQSLDFVELSVVTIQFVLCFVVISEFTLIVDFAMDLHVLINYSIVEGRHLRNESLSFLEIWIMNGAENLFLLSTFVDENGWLPRKFEEVFGPVIPTGGHALRVYP